MVFAKLQENILNKDFNKNMQKEISTFSDFKCKIKLFSVDFFPSNENFNSKVMSA